MQRMPGQRHGRNRVVQSVHRKGRFTVVHAGRTALGGAGFLATGCNSATSTLNPASPFADAVARLWWAMLGGGVAVLVLVTVLALLATFRPATLRRIPDRGFLVAGGIALPLAAVLALTAGATATGGAMHRFSPHDPPLRIEATARQWEWRFRYTDHPRVAATPGVLRLPAGTDIEITTTSEDVIHSFWVPELGGKVDATPGHRTTMWLRAGPPGTHAGLCAEYCGIGHPGMPFMVEVMDPDAFARWLGSQP